MTPNIARPLVAEYSPSTKGYIDLVPDDGDVLGQLEAGRAAIGEFVRSLGDDRLTYRYAPGKWTVKEILIHIADTERIFAYRALRIARGDTTPLPGFEQDDYTPLSGANERAIAGILEEYDAVRHASLLLFRSFDGAALIRAGTASGHPLTVRAAVYQVIGHELHHLRVMKERYAR